MSTVKEEGLRKGRIGNGFGVPKIRMLMQMGVALLRLSMSAVGLIG
jgi:hypothetical protein